jgi:hypothetical protein
MMSDRRVVLPCALGLMFSFSPSFAATLSPGNASVQIGHEVFVSIEASDVSDLYSFQFDLSFDPTRLRLQDIIEGQFLRSGGTTIFVPGAIDNSAGIATITAGSLVGAVPGVSGGGPLAWFGFLGLAAGTSPLVLSNVVLLDSALNDVPSDTNGGRVVVGVTPVPEPGTFIPIGACLLAFLLFARGLLG